MTFLRSTAASEKRVLAEGPPPCGLPACPAGRSRYSCRRYRPVHHAAVIKAWISSYSRRRPGEIDLVGARDFADLPAIPRQPDHPWMKQRDIALELLGRVQFRIDGDEQRLHRLAHRSELVDRSGNRLQVGRAGIRASGEAEIDQEQLVSEVSVGPALAIVVDQRERAPRARFCPGK